uniref:Uncharacterized protein n=1 Tax=Arundo donax TaxID=35708 RepID=A0A0A8ZN95_ARUDO
MGSRRRPR